MPGQRGLLHDLCYQRPKDHHGHPHTAPLCSHDYVGLPAATAGLGPTHDRLAHPAPAIIPSVSGGEARHQVAGLGRSWSAAPH
jgi:hypothetical protein